MCFFSDEAQLWKLDDGILRNKADNSILGKEWYIKTKKTFINIVDVSDEKMVIGTSNNDTVIEEKLVDGKSGQLWKKGKPDAEGYFSLESSESSKILTATSSSKLEVLGKQVMHLFLFLFIFSFALLFTDSKQIWTRRKAADGFYTFSIRDGNSKKFLTAKGKHKLIVTGKIL